MPAGRMTMPIEAAGLSMNCSGFQPSSCALRIACTANLGVLMLRKTLALVAGEVDDLRIDGGVGHLVAHLAHDDRLGLVAQPVA